MFASFGGGAVTVFPKNDDAIAPVAGVTDTRAVRKDFDTGLAHEGLVTGGVRVGQIGGRRNCGVCHGGSFF